VDDDQFGDDELSNEDGQSSPRKVEIDMMMGEIEIDDRTRMIHSNGASLDKLERKSTVATSETK
jgi:hypothetical protein